MPKRVIDGDALWKSKKLRTIQPATYRAEYANLIPLALANGVFECDPDLVWATVYAYNRPDYGPDEVAALLTEFERAGMLFRWRDDNGKQWGYWVAIDQPGRLPSIARQKERHERTGPQVPLDALRKYVEETNGSLLADHTATNREPIGSLGLGLGSGTGFGSGLGGVGENIASAKNAPAETKYGMRLPKDFKVTDEHRIWAREHSMPAPDSEIDHFRDHWNAKAGKDARKLDWDAVFRNWLRSPLNRRSANGKTSSLLESIRNSDKSPL